MFFKSYNKFLGYVQFAFMQSISKETQDPIDVQAYWSIIKRNWLPFVTVASLVFGFSVLATFLQKPVYEAEGKLLLSKKDRVSSLTDLTNEAKEISGLTQTTKPVDTETEIIQSVPLVEKTIASLNLKNGKGQPMDVEKFLTQLKVKGIRETDVILLSYRGTNPQQAAAVVNSLMRFYLENNIRANRAEMIAAREFITSQLPMVEARVTAADVALRQFKESNRVVALDEEAKVTVKKLSDLSEQLTDAKVKLAEVTGQTQAIQRRIGLDPQQAITLTTINQSVAVQKVLAEYRQVQDQLVILRTRYQPGHPELASLARKEAALRSQLQSRIAQALGTNQPFLERDLQLSQFKQSLAQDLVKAEAERLGLANRVSALSAAIAYQQNRVSAMPQLEQKQRELERRLQAAQSTYEQLLKRLQAVQVTENQNVGNAHIVSEALVPQKAVSPRIFLNLSLGAVMGIAIGALTAIALDSIDQSVKTVEEAQNLAGYPLLGIVPMASVNSNGRVQHPIFSLPMRGKPCSAVGTSFEMLQAALVFTFLDQPLKVILVTSAVSGEGKSFIAANLAVATAQTGRRVLLVDADMRQPSQHTIWQQMNLKGLSDILVGQATFPETVKVSHAKLDVLTSGTTPLNPIALLDSQKLASLIQSATQKYDFIILDAPALTLAPDSLILGKLVDGVLFVVSPSVADSAAVKQATTLLSQAGHRVLGMVVNGSLSKQKKHQPLLRKLRLYLTSYKVNKPSKEPRRSQRFDKSS